MDWLQNFMDQTSIILVIILFLVGLFCIVKGGDVFVDAASWMAEVTGIPKLIVGATVVSLATTLPELLVSVFATISGDIGIATGNAIGSVTANLGLIMGLSLVCIPAVINRKDFYFKSALMLFPLMVMFVFCFNGKADGVLKIFPSIVLFGVFAINVIDNVVAAKKQVDLDNKLAKSEERVIIKPEKKDIVKNVILFIVGALGIVAGAELLVSSATRIATDLGVSDTIIGLTVVAVGTSLPELVTTVTAIIKKESSLSVGNIIGANIIDLTIILSICSFVSGGNLVLYEQGILFDIPVCFLIGLVGLVPALIKGKFMRWQGIVMLLLYVAYVALLVVGVDVLGVTPAPM